MLSWWTSEASAASSIADTSSYEKSRGGFVLTNLGKRARQTFDDTDIFRKQPSTTFSSYIRTIKALTRTA